MIVKHDPSAHALTDVAAPPSSSPWAGEMVATFDVPTTASVPRGNGNVADAPSMFVTASFDDAVTAATAWAAEHTVREHAPALAVLQATDGRFHVSPLYYDGVYAGAVERLTVQVEAPYGVSRIEAASPDLKAIVDRSGVHWRA